MNQAIATTMADEKMVADKLIPSGIEPLKVGSPAEGAEAVKADIEKYKAIAEVVKTAK